MYLQFQHSFAYTFPKAINQPLKINYPGPGAYNPGEDNEMINPPKWKFGSASRDNKIQELSPGPAKYNYDLEYRKLSNVPTAPNYTFYKTSGVIPRKRKKKNKINNTNNNINNFQLDNNFKGGDNAENFQNLNFKRPKTGEIKKSKKKKKKYKLNNNYDDDDDIPGVGSYNIRSSLIVPVVKFGTERKDIAYKDTPSRGPASYDIRGNLGNFGPKINFGKEKRGIKYFSFSPGPGKYNLRNENNISNGPKYSFNHDVRIKEENFHRKKIVLERNFLKPEKYKKIYVFKEDKNVNVDERNNNFYNVTNYNFSHTGFPEIDRKNFIKSFNGQFSNSYKTFYDDSKIEERKNYDFNNFRKPAWVSRKFYKQYLNQCLINYENKKKIHEEIKKNQIENNEIKINEDEIINKENEKKNEKEENIDKENENTINEDVITNKQIEKDEKKINEDNIKEGENGILIKEDEKQIEKDEKKINEDNIKKGENEILINEDEKQIEKDEKNKEDNIKKGENEILIKEDEKQIEKDEKKNNEDNIKIKEESKKEKSEEILIIEENKLNEHKETQY